LRSRDSYLSTSAIQHQLTLKIHQQGILADIPIATPPPNVIRLVLGEQS
jgi:hypothetical protein